MKKTRIALIVDHPLRDLPGLALISKYLAQNNCEVFLVPMYNQERECLSLAPDFVLLNYLRKNNEAFVERLKKCQIQYGINDTEGGFYGDLDYYGRILSDNAELIQSLRCNLVWGQKMFSYLAAHPLWKTGLRLTGLPRFDFYSKKFKDINLDSIVKSPDQKNFALINTKVAVANPLFVTVEKEIQIYRKLGISEAQIQHYLKYGSLSIKDNIELAHYLGEKFPQWAIVIRPHPHENEKTYENQIKDGAQNVSVHREGPVIPWILKSKVVLHRHCTTAIEAAIAEKPVVSPLWVNTSANSPDSEVVSHQIANHQELLQAMQLAEKDQLSATPQIKSAVQRIIDDWLYQVDGESHSRVGQEILNCMTDQRANISKCQKEVYNIFDHRTDFKGKLYTKFSQMSSIYPHPLWMVEKLRLKKWTSTQKYFTPQELRNWIDPVCTLENSQKLKIDWATDTGSYLESYQGHSVRVTL